MSVLSCKYVKRWMYIGTIIKGFIIMALELRNKL